MCGDTVGTAASGRDRKATQTARMETEETAKRQEEGEQERDTWRAPNRHRNLRLSEADFARLETQWLTLMERVKHFGRVSSGNRVKIYHEGDEVFSSILRSIGSAEKTILMEFYIYDNSAVGRAIKDALCAAAQRGCFVVLVVDWVGGFNMPTVWQDDLVAAGVNVVIFNPPFPLALHGLEHDSSPRSSLSYLAATAKHILAYGKGVCKLLFASPASQGLENSCRGTVEPVTPLPLASRVASSPPSPQSAGGCGGSPPGLQQTPGATEAQVSLRGSRAHAPGSLWADRVGPIPFRDHRKNLVVDGKVAFVGSVNVAEDAVGAKFGGRNHFYDLHVRVRGPAVKALEALFVETLETSNARPLRDRLVSHLAKVDTEQEARMPRFGNWREGTQRNGGLLDGHESGGKTGENEPTVGHSGFSQEVNGKAVVDLGQSSGKLQSSLPSSSSDACFALSESPCACVSSSSSTPSWSFSFPPSSSGFSWSRLRARLLSILPWRKSSDREDREATCHGEERRNLLLGWKAVRMPARRAETETEEVDDDADDATDVLVQVLESNVMRNQRSIQAVLKSAIYNATVSLYVTAAYFVPPGFLRRALQTALGRDGVDVSLLLSGDSDVWGDVYATTYVARKFLRWLTPDTYPPMSVEDEDATPSPGSQDSATSPFPQDEAEGNAHGRKERASESRDAKPERTGRRQVWRSLRGRDEPKGEASVYFLSSRHCHAKNIVVDHLWSTIGSFNLDRFSSRRNMEVLLAFLDPAIALKFEDLYWQHVQNGEAERMTVEKWNSQSLAKKVICFFCYYVTRFAGKNFFDGLSDQRSRAVFNRLLIASYLDDMPASDLSTSMLWGFQ
ncbi:hypothetical protein NCLIV_054060 [Neospora caninum Liverpool]|uniref:PLD phosphodiesterase domain-containing protein n=1 Tax=Neospora caninum (strain Liverpool) TaxID=572307 RepID=F0VMN3_NEOCL|nr:hypothetical protein NCLIV_054060 [Neospora caninum Liverpool]CBZ54979.1 hypothetical protein NCLIV_054060 [Neospora caninum Liverpool]|eukprot:XP_003885007.1 hypothetical protein NCLIV_054060 [Neospora caninum Liverpool]